MTAASSDQDDRLVQDAHVDEACVGEVPADEVPAGETFADERAEQACASEGAEEAPDSALEGVSGGFISSKYPQNRDDYYVKRLTGNE